MEDIVIANNIVPIKKSNKVLKIKTFFLSFIATFLSIILIGIFLMYGPISYFREAWVTTAMSTLRHQWLATMFFDQKTIDQIMAKNKTVEPAQNTDPNAVTVVSKVKDNATTLPTSPSDGEHIIDGIGFTMLKGSTYNGWLVKIYDPSRLYMGISQNFGKSGEQVSHMVQRLNAYVGINAGGFIDVNGEGNGGTPDALFISGGKILTPSTKSAPHSIIGFDNNNKLVLEKVSTSALSSLNLKNAVEFSPFFIMNGVASEITGNGGGGLQQPRTAVGQTQTGTIIFVIIDGRTVVSPGATFKDVQNIMLDNGAYNAANLDGGASSTLVYNGTIVNHPSSHDGERYLPNAFLINHTSNYK